jgi:hypothetical protein
MATRSLTPADRQHHDVERDQRRRNLPSHLAGQKPATGRAALNGESVKMFPDEGSRPARHTLALGADGNALVTCDFVAVFS